MVFHVTMQVKTTFTMPIEAADAAEAKELALDMAVDEIGGSVLIEDMVVEKRVTDVSETAPDFDDLDPEGLELYGDRPVDDDDDFPQEDDARPGYDY